MAQKVIITIGRQYGSGGREIGRLVSQMLDIPFYDKELLAEAARTSGISQSLFERADEKGSGSLLYSMATGVYNLGGRMAPVNDLSIPDRLYLTQCNAMRQIAARGSCVIVGRCSDYVLAEEADAVHTFIYASAVFRTRRIMELEDKNEQQARARIAKVDKQRASYYSYYTGNKWGQAENYNLSIDSGCIGVENAARLIVDFAGMKLR